MSNDNSKKSSGTRVPNYPRSSLEKALRIPTAILEQNAGRDCTDEESAAYVGIKYNKGPYFVEINTAIKYGLLERSDPGKLKLTDIARKILKPQESDDYLTGVRAAPSPETGGPFWKYQHTVADAYVER